MIPDEAEIFEYVNTLLNEACSEYDKHFAAWDAADKEDNLTVKILEAGNVSFFKGQMEILSKVRKFIMKGVRE